MSTVRVFLIADVRGYTSFTERHGDVAAGRLVAVFAALVRRVAESHDGTVVELRGDEALVVFDSPRQALRASIAMQGGFATESSGEGEGQLPVGIGLDAGEAVELEGGYRGGALNVAARLCGLAGPGEVMASREVARLAGTVEGLVYEDRGSVALRHLARSVDVVRVVKVDAGPSATFSSLASDQAEKPEARLRIVVADDSVLLREGLVRVLVDAGNDVVAQAGDAEELLAAVRTNGPDLVVTDIRMPPTHTDEGLRAARQIREEFPDVGVLVLSQYVEARHALDLLADSPDRVGYLLKDRVANVADLADAVRRVSKGQAVIDPEVVSHLLKRRRHQSALDELTDPEREVLQLMAEGRSDRAICEQLSLAPEAIEDRISSIFAKLGLDPEGNDHRRVLAVLAYLRAR